MLHLKAYYFKSKKNLHQRVSEYAVFWCFWSIYRDASGCPFMISGQSALHHHEGQQRVTSVAQCCSLLSGHLHSDFRKPTTSGFTLDNTFVYVPSFHAASADYHSNQSPLTSLTTSEPDEPGLFSNYVVLQFSNFAKGFFSIRPFKFFGWSSSKKWVSRQPQTKLNQRIFNTQKISFPKLPTICMKKLFHTLTFQFCSSLVPPRKPKFNGTSQPNT
jgi:hypothetical protein